MAHFSNLPIPEKSFPAQEAKPLPPCFTFSFCSSTTTATTKKQSFKTQPTKHIQWSHKLIGSSTEKLLPSPIHKSRLWWAQKQKICSRPQSAIIPLAGTKGIVLRCPVGGSVTLSFAALSRDFCDEWINESQPNVRGAKSRRTQVVELERSPVLAKTQKTKGFPVSPFFSPEKTSPQQDTHRNTKYRTGRKVRLMISPLSSFSSNASLEAYNTASFSKHGHREETQSNFSSSSDSFSPDGRDSFFRPPSSFFSFSSSSSCSSVPRSFTLATLTAQRPSQGLSFCLPPGSYSVYGIKYNESNPSPNSDSSSQAFGSLERFKNKENSKMDFRDFIKTKRRRKQQKEESRDFSFSGVYLQWKQKGIRVYNA